MYQHELHIHNLQQAYLQKNRKIIMSQSTQVDLGSEICNVTWLFE